jgi:hypothetical protein
VVDLPTIVEEFAQRWDSLLPAYAGRDDYRVLVTTGALVAVAVIIGQLVDDGIVVLLGIEMDLAWPDELGD